MTPGYHRGIPMAKYLADPCVVPSLSSSIAQTLLRESARKAWFSHPRLNPAFAREEDSKFDIGTAAHALLLEGMDIIYPIDAPDFRTKEAKAHRDTARALGKIPLLTKHKNAVIEMAAVAQGFIETSEIADQWKDGESEVTAVCEERGVWLRCRMDRVTKNRRFIIDYKSTTDAAPETFSRQLVRMGYQVQDSFYRRIARNLGAIGPRFVFVAQSTEPPYECSLHGCDESLQEIADAEVERAIQLWRECVTQKVWPSYGPRIHWALPPTYLMQEHEMRLQEAA